MRGRRRAEEGEHGGPSMERWLLTYADMITLLMIFFILMYVISSVNIQRFRVLAQALSVTLKGEPTGLFNEQGPSFVPGENDESFLENNESLMMSQARKELEAYLQQHNLTGKVTVSEEERGLVVSFQELTLFRRGSATLTPESRPIIASVGKILQKTTNYIRVEGHTCNLPINNSQFPSNWELSSARALTVLHEFIRDGLPPWRLSATGYGEYRPRYPNDTEEHRKLNRRVDIVLLRSKYKETEPSLLVQPVIRSIP